MTIAENLKRVEIRIQRACERAGRKRSDVTLIAVSKTHPVEKVVEANEAGAAFFGENKVQEGLEKIPVFEGKAEWHLIGHLQKNKVRKAVQVFDVIQTVDSVKLADRIERIAHEESRDIAAFLQVDLADEETKFGVKEQDVFRIAESFSKFRKLSLVGLMTIPPYFQDPEDVRVYFERLRELRNELENDGVFEKGTGFLSMGMSHDFEVAIEEGATHIRVGTAIFGKRNYI